MFSVFYVFSYFYKNTIKLENRARSTRIPLRSRQKRLEGIAETRFGTSGTDFLQRGDKKDERARRLAFWPPAGAPGSQKHVKTLFSRTPPGEVGTLIPLGASLQNALWRGSFF